MKMGIKEFRQRISEVADGDEVVELTHHGRRVGRYVPERLRAPRAVDLDAWLAEREETGRQWRATTPDWRDRLRAFGITEAEISEMEAADRCS